MPSIVGICPICGKHIIAKTTHSKKQYCSKVCRDRDYQRKHRCDHTKMLCRERQAGEAARWQQLEEMRARLAARDEAYASVAPKTTVEVVNGRRIETRGVKIIGMRASL